MRASVNGHAQSRSPYNITTGSDDNERPAAVVNDRRPASDRNAARPSPDST